MLFFTLFYLDLLQVLVPAARLLLFAGAFYLGSFFETKRKAVQAAGAYSLASAAGIVSTLLVYLYLMGFFDAVRLENQATQVTFAYALTSLIFNFVAGSITSLLSLFVLCAVFSLIGSMALKRVRSPQVGILKPVACLFAVWLVVLAFYSSTGYEAAPAEDASFRSLKTCEKLAGYPPSYITEYVNSSCDQLNSWFMSAENTGVVYTRAFYFETDAPSRNKFMRNRYELTTLFYDMLVVSHSGLFDVWNKNLYNTSVPDYALESHRYLDSFSKLLAEKQYADALVECLDFVYDSYGTAEKTFEYVYVNMPDAESKLGPKELLDGFVDEQKKLTAIMRNRTATTAKHAFYNLGEPTPPAYAGIARPYFSEFMDSGDYALSTTLDVCRQNIGRYYSRLSANGTYLDGNKTYLKLENTGYTNMSVGALLVNGYRFGETSCNGKISVNEKKSCEFELGDDLVYLKEYDYDLDKFVTIEQTDIVISADLGYTKITLDKNNNFTYKR